MKYFWLFFFAFPSLIFAAAGDILSVTINTDGRSATIRVEGVAGGGTYLYDAANSSLVTTASAKIVFAVTSDSFTTAGAATTRARTVYGAETQRTPGSANLNETVAGSDLDIVIALTEPLYNDDTLTVTMLTDWYTKTGVPSAAVTAGAVTNSSTLDYYVPFGQWDILPMERHASDFRVAFTARHLHGIACVKFTATGATSMHSQTATVTAESSRRRHVSGLYGNAHEATLALSGFTQTELINLKAEIFPLVGDTEMDTDDFTIGGGYYEVEGRGPITAYCDKNNTARVYGVVNAGTGNDGTGVTSTTLATAEANKYATIKGAIDGNATWVYLEGAAHTFSARSTNKSYNHWLTVEPHPDEAGTVTVTVPNSFPGTWDVVRLKLKDVTVANAGTTAIMNGALTDYICFEGCTFDTTAGSMSQHHYDFLGSYYKDCTFDDMARWRLNRTGGYTQRFWIDGCVIPAASYIPLSAFWHLTANTMSGDIESQTIVTVGNAIKNCLIDFNKLNDTSYTQTFFSHSTNSGYSFVGNLMEGVSVSPSALISIAGTAAYDIDHVIVAHNTVIGQRTNIFYNDSGTTAYYSRGVRVAGNIFDPVNTKHDLFAPASANRVGRWWTNWGTSMTGNFNCQNSSFDPEYPGLNYVDSGTVAFVNDQSGAGSGNGNYRLKASSGAIGLVTAGNIFAAYDIDGNARVAGDAAGAYHFDGATGFFKFFR